MDVFDLNKFLQHKESTPSILCFPTFFNCSIFSIINQAITYYYLTLLQEENYDNVAEYNSFIFQIDMFFQILPTMMKFIINGTNDDDDIRFKNHKEIVAELLKIIKTQTFDKENSFQFLEWYLKDVESIRAYQKALYEANIQFNKNDEEKLTLLQPTQHSQNYVIKTEMPINVWGPIYWNVFHSLPRNALINSNNLTIETILPILYYMISILPLLVPCSQCKKNYYKHVKPSKLLFNNFPTVESFIAIYSAIHENVTQHKMGLNVI